jgi:hypothetical protein
MQYNKRDLPDALPLDVLRRALNPNGKYAEYEAIATDGTGCRESLRDVAQQLLKKLNATANIVTDEEVVTERLGVAGSGPSLPRTSMADRNAPELRVNQDSKFHWRGLGIGSGEVKLTSTKNERGEMEYALSSTHKILGLKRELKRTMRYVGEDKRNVEGVDRTYVVLRDASAGKGMAPVAGFIDKSAGAPRLYLVYPGMMGEMKVGPEGEIVPV